MKAASVRSKREPKTANGAQEFAKTIATSRMKKGTAIYGMIKGDTTRFNAEALTDFLKRIGTTPEEWNRE